MLDLYELARRLNEEKLFVNSEKETIKRLHEQVLKGAEILSQSFWITCNQYKNLNHLIRNTSLEGNIKISCKKAEVLDNMNFVNSYDELGYENSASYCQFVEELSKNPTLIGACLAYGDILNLEITQEVASIFVLSCYGNHIVSENFKPLLELLETLILLQLGQSDQPRRLLQKAKCSFSVVYNLFVESLMPAKMFLMMALHEPIMQVITSDDLCLESDQNKLLAMLSDTEIEKKFGRKNHQNFKDHVTKQIQKNEKYLVEVCKKFVENLLKSFSSFPKCLSWVIARAYHIVKDAGLVSDNEAKALCFDFFLQNFVCPAILDPERYGITGTVPVNKLSSNNLMQIAQKLQTVAHMKLTESNQTNSNVNQQLISVKQTIDEFINLVVSSCPNEYENRALTSQSVKNIYGHVSCAVYITTNQLAQLVLYLQQIQLSNVHGVDQASLSKVLSHLPKNPSEKILRATAALLNKRYNPYITVKNDLVKDGSSSPISRQNSLISINENLFSFAEKSKNNVSEDLQVEKVLVFSLSPPSGVETSTRLGMLSDVEVLRIHHNRSSENGNIQANSEDFVAHIKKEPHFPMFDGSNIKEIGETDDANNTQSDVTSSVEDVTNDDNSSSLVGAGSSNHQEDEEEAGDLESVKRSSNDEALKALRNKIPTSRESINEMMRKFEINKNTTGEVSRSQIPNTQQQGQLQQDARSETWSVDVYASDGEGVQAQDSLEQRTVEGRSVVNGNEVANQEALRRMPSSLNNQSANRNDEFDNRSDIWSVEVLASDSEQNTVDTQADYRLHDLENEANVNSVNHVDVALSDVADSNRSRASTPGLSAASGYSAVSALSMLSSITTDQLNNKVADQPTTSGPSLSQQQSSTNTSPDPQENLQVQPTLVAQNGNGKMQRASGDTSTTKSAKEKSVNWKLPPTFGQVNNSDAGSSSEGIGTIKRSPYKRPTSSQFSKEHPIIRPKVVTAWQPDIKNVALSLQDVSEFDPLSTPQTLKDSSMMTSETKLHDQVNPNQVILQTKETNQLSHQEFPSTSSQQHSNRNKAPGKVERKRSSWWKGTPKFSSSTRKTNKSSAVNKIKPIKNVNFSTPGKATDVVDSSIVAEKQVSLKDTARVQSGEDIMAKYELKISSKNNDGALNSSQILQSTSKQCSWKQNSTQLPQTSMSDEQLVNDAIKKLRIVMSSAQFRHVESFTFVSKTNTKISQNYSKKVRVEILKFVQNQLSQARLVQDQFRISQLTEAERCVNNLTEDMCKKIFQKLFREHSERSVYIEYLVRCRQHLLNTCSYFRNFQLCIDNDKVVCRKYFTRQCVKLFVKEKESRVQAFARQFMRLIALDDKSKRIQEFISELHGQLIRWEPRYICCENSEEVTVARCEIEKIMFSTVYKVAMFPNQDADRSRDELYSAHIDRLSSTIVPDHPKLQIPSKYLVECPWTSAQQQAKSMSTFRSPRGKLQAAVRCCNTIMMLLKMADEKDTPGADALMPVLTYVLIKANPSHLLSTVQFVIAYIGDDLHGEDSYWWTQFCSATEFIKTFN